MITEFVITAGEQPKRLDVFLVHREPRLSRAALQRLIAQGRVRLNGRPAKASQKIKPGDQITFDKPSATPLTRSGAAAPLDILFEDEHLLVLNKPAGIVVHPGPGHWNGTLVSALLHHLQASPLERSFDNKSTRPGLVHRLDKDTSGIMVIAKTEEAHRNLASQFEAHSITRVYEALVSGVPTQREGLVELAIGRDKTRRAIVSSYTRKPKSSSTEYRVQQTYGSTAAHLWLFPKSGRTHQLRVHMQSIGHPILGDQRYRDQEVSHSFPLHVSRLMLHASALGFSHPATGLPQHHTVPLPADMAKMLQLLEAGTKTTATSGS